MKKAQIVGRDPLPSDQQRAESVVPAVGAFDDPSPRLSAYAANQWSFATPANMETDAARTDDLLDVLVVVAFVEAEILRPAWSTRRPHSDGVERLGDHPFVVHVGARDGRGERDAAAIRQYVPLYAGFGSIGRIGTGVVPPFGAFAMALSIDDHFHWIPRRSS
jgi:hypothetical protein